jgi:acetoacetate decarboxylase
MELTGYTRPFSPGGIASILEAPPPYGFSTIQYVIHFRTDAQRLNELIPDPLQPHDAWQGQAFWMATDHMMTPVNFPAALEWHPDRRRFFEAAVAIPCVFRESPGLFYPYAWVDREWALVMEWLSGMCGKLAHVTMAAAEPTHPPSSGPARGDRFAATVDRLGARLATADIVLEEPALQRPFDEFLRVYAMRHIPDFAMSGDRPAPLVHQLVTERFSATTRRVVWRGTGTLTFEDAENEWLLPIQPSEILGAYYVTADFVTEGMDVLHDYLADAKPAASIPTQP